MNWIQKEMKFDGSDINQYDNVRLTGQIKDIYNLMKDGHFRTLSEIEELTNHPQSSISAQLRNLRKDRFGNHQIDKRRRYKGTWEYKLCL